MARNWTRRHPTLASAAAVAIVVVAVAWGTAGYLGWGWPAGFGGATILASLPVAAAGAVLTGVTTSLEGMPGTGFEGLAHPELRPGTSDGFGFQRAGNALLLAAPMVLAVGFALLGLAAVA